ncbi:transposase [Rugamonas sp.]|uniref:transposase n=1 Tax=Rugamonas sp. TaxID=1926287 RepID=UPI0025E88679|nr:transposase [Rugamonas sp.]
MPREKRTRYPLEFRIEAIQLVRSGQTIAAAARIRGIARNTLSNWVKAEIHGNLTEVPSRSLDGEDTEVSRLRTELARVTMERDMLIKLVIYFAKV